MDARPKLSELIQHADVGVHWYELGIHLEIDTRRLNEIQQEGGSHKLAKMYQLWLDSNPEPKTTRRTIIETLQTCEENAVAHKYKKYVLELQVKERRGGTEDIDCAGVMNGNGGDKAAGSGGGEQQEILDITNLDQVLTHLRHKHFNKRDWRDLGLTLGVYSNTLDTIEADYPRDTNRCLQECLGKWLRGADRVRALGNPVTLMTLDAAIDAIL